MSDKNVKIFLLLAGFYFIARDTTAAMFLYSRQTTLKSFCDVSKKDR